MIYSFDKLPAPIRARLRVSPFNICAACVLDYWHGLDVFLSEQERIATTLERISGMERQIREQERNAA